MAQSLPAQSKTDRRRETRFEVYTDCLVTRTTGRQKTMRAQVANISREGFLVRWSPEGHALIPRAGETLHVRIDLPANPTVGPKCMELEGTVRRVTRDWAGTLLIAAQVSKRAIRRRAG